MTSKCTQNNAEIDKRAATDEARAVAPDHVGMDFSHQCDSLTGGTEASSSV